MFPVSEVDSSCSFKNLCDLTSEFKDSHGSLCFILTFHKICIFLMKRTIEILELFHMRGVVIYSLYTRKRIQYFTVLLISRLQSQVITTICRTVNFILMMNEQHNILCFKKYFTVL